jgi:phenylacetate-CoA ligase
MRCEVALNDLSMCDWKGLQKRPSLGCVEIRFRRPCSVTDDYSPFVVNSLGSREVADRTARRALAQVKAYRQFVARCGVNPQAPLESLPLQDKEGYLRQYPFADLLGEDFAETFTIFSSAGSGGHAFYWPQLKRSYADSPGRLRLLLETMFAIHRHRTLAIVGLALGSWIGGDVLSWSLKDVAVAAPYPFAVFSPGNKHDEIIAMVDAAAAMVDQVLLICCPSAIGHLILRSEEVGQPLPLARMRYFVIGEPFPEALRIDLERRSGCAEGETLMVSVYGSADTGVLGFESPASILLRKLCHADPILASSLGIEGLIPHFFHQADPETFLEAIDGELCITKWQGIPLIRYNLHDRAHLYDWPSLIRHLVAFADRSEGIAQALPLLNQFSALLPAQGLIAVAGRSDNCLILCGTKVTEAMLDDAVRSVELPDMLTGVYEASVVTEQGRQRIYIRLETHKRNNTGPDAVALIYPRLVRAIGRAQPEFLDDWTSIYHKWDNDPDRRILKLELVPWPALSEGLRDRIKQRSILERPT